MREDRDFDRALEAIANGASIRQCGLPKSTVLNRAQRDNQFASRLAAAQQTGHLWRVSEPHVDDGPTSRDEVIASIAGQARAGRGWACKLMLELLDQPDQLADDPFADVVDISRRRRPR